MRIGIDARFFGSIGKGLGRYTQKLIENLEIIDKNNDYFIFLRKENFNEYQPKNPHFKKVLADYRWYSFSEQINMPKILNKYKLDLVHFPHFNVPLFYKNPFIVTIHDLILVHFPTVRGTTLNPLFYWLKYAAYKLVIKAAIKRAQKIITVSYFTKKDILKHYKIPENKIVVTYEASEMSFPTEKTSNDTAILKNYGIIKPYILYVGNAYPHKNLEALILAFQNFNQDRKYQLVLVGKEDYFYKRLIKFTRDNQVDDVVFTNFVSDEKLNVIYYNALAYVFPSLYEGFGLPPLEAMARGVPVASADHQCMREILEESVYYFDAKKLDNITRALKKITSDGVLRKNLSIKGYEQVKKYSWQKMAKETLEIYKNFQFPISNC